MVETMLFERRMTQHEARTIGFALTRSSDEARQELLSLFGVSEDEVTALRGERDYGKAHRHGKLVLEPHGMPRRAPARRVGAESPATVRTRERHRICTAFSPFPRGS